ncbi:hypothetical protein PENSPDRAFT_648007 [Peniophora sp. CONT]|nr:hypothetical protein PENSPDRAFT_648007 [Peniophora sp. CONT]
MFRRYALSAPSYASMSKLGVESLSNAARPQFVSLSLLLHIVAISRLTPSATGDTQVLWQTAPERRSGAVALARRSALGGASART